MTLFAALAVPVQLAAQEPQQKTDKTQYYTVQDLGTLKGTYSAAEGLTNDDLVVGTSTTLNDANVHGFLWWWWPGMIDLGTLGGPNRNSEIDRKGVNELGEVVGYSDTSTLDPNGEDWCGFGTHLICLPFLWQYGVMTPLPTLGGNNGAAYAINNWGQVVGMAEYSNLDPTCAPYTGYQAGAFLWKNGKITNLPPFTGDPDAAAFAINDSGQATGGSANCFYFFHALLWQGGKATDLGNLGGSYGIYGIDINNQGQVVGLSDLLGDTTFHGFLWQKSTGMKDLGTLPGDVVSAAISINSKGQVVGWSCAQYISECSLPSAVLWQNGVITDLNTLIPPGSPLFLDDARTINDWGQIAGEALQISTGEYHAFLATPTTRYWAISERPKVVLPENARKLLQQRPRFGGLRSRWGQLDHPPGPGTGPTN
jgi:probable HAF family extracellular repeat protein